MLLWTVAAQAQDLVLDGEVPDDGLDHFLVPFEVPAGTVEIEVHHDDQSAENILDWGLDDPAGWRGWGGGNSEPAVVGVEAASRSYVPGPIPAGTWSVVVGKAKIVDPPGTYHLEIWLRTAPTLAPQPERAPYADVPALETGRRWYAGDFHVHSRESGDAQPTLDEIATFAEEAGLDFVVLTDHDTVTQDDLILDAQARHPHLLLVPGTEYTTYQGHASAIGATGWVDHKLGQPGVTVQAAVDAYHGQGALFSINHPALDLGDLCIGCAWTADLPSGIDGVEIENGGWQPTGVLFTPLAIAFWEELWDAGQTPVAIGGSDDHTAGQSEGAFGSPIGHPTTMVLADELSVPALLDGIRAGHTVVKLDDPTDPMVELDGLTADVTGARGGDLVWVVDGRARPAVPIDGDPFHAELADVAPGSRVRAEVWEDGWPHTVTSYGWYLPGDRPPGEGGCGCGTPAGAGPGWFSALVALTIAGRRRR